METIQPLPNTVKCNTLDRTAQWKTLDPMTSVSAPRLAQVSEESGNGIMLRVARYTPTGTIVQVHMYGKFSLWKVLRCFPHANGYHLGLEFAELVSAAPPC